jgi:membrane protein implicated in regulation of membrane protease activity
LVEDSEENAESGYAGLLSKVRFGPGIIVMLSAIALTAVILYLSGHAYLAAIVAAVLILLFGVKSMEIIHLSRPENRPLVGRRCIVMRRVGKEKVGVVRVYGPHGRLDPELWSAESEYEILEGQEAIVAGMRSIVLIVLPSNPSGLDDHCSNLTSSMVKWPESPRQCGVLFTIDRSPLKTGALRTKVSASPPSKAMLSP